MTQQGSETTRAGAKLREFMTKKRLAAGGLALGGMIVGAVVGIGVQAGIESTGLLGPSVESLIAEQESNFSSLQSRLDELGELSSDPAVTAGLAELKDLLARQESLQARANRELVSLSGAVADLKQQSLSEQGFAAGTADFWLDVGESVTVGDAGHVFGLLTKRNGFVAVNLDGDRSNMTPGDVRTVESNGRSCSIHLKRLHSAQADPVGFDVNCV